MSQTSEILCLVNIKASSSANHTALWPSRVLTTPDVKWSTKQWDQVHCESTNRLKTISLRSVHDKEPCCMGSVYQRRMGRRPSLFLNSPHHPRSRLRRVNTLHLSWKQPFLGIFAISSSTNSKPRNLSIPENGKGCYPARSRMEKLATSVVQRKPSGGTPVCITRVEDISSPTTSSTSVTRDHLATLGLQVKPKPTAIRNCHCRGNGIKIIC